MPIPKALTREYVRPGPLATLVTSDRFTAPADLLADLKQCNMMEAFIAERQHLAATLDDLLKSMLQHRPFVRTNQRQACASRAIDGRKGTVAHNPPPSSLFLSAGLKLLSRSSRRLSSSRWSGRSSSRSTRLVFVPTACARR